MTKKQDAVLMIKKKLQGDSFYTYKEIANFTGYHPKYILKLKKYIINNNISLVHGNKNRKPSNALSEEEKNKIINLYKKSSVSIRKFCKFYSKRSYSCIYNTLKTYEKSLTNN
ncbi:MAG: hypothetical protein NC181_00105 [Clostridium sp.]|nr:hypothetical protein [Clostridium sp.]MCM1443922.1 hypothetical protein [Candidatus Amulumruptor caecigallinarius]